MPEARPEREGISCPSLYLDEESSFCHFIASFRAKEMSSPTERTPAKVETLLGGLDMETLMAFADNDIESIYETLQEPFEDMERKIVVSSMVQEAVAKGFLKALEEESCTQLACKDREIDHLKDRLKEKDASIADLQKVLGIREDDVSVADSSDRSRYQHLWDFMQESQKKWRESEASVYEKERELERLASSMAHMASILDNENKRAALLNKQLNDLKEQETIKTGQISSLQQEINKLKNDSSRLKRQARLKVLQFDESMEQTQGELQQQRLELERLAQEREGLEKALEDKNKAFSDLENGYRASGSKVSSMDEKVKSLLMVESTLQEIIEGQKLMQEGERDVLMTYMEQQMIKIHSELGQFLDGSQFSHPQQAVRQWQLSSWDAGDPSEAKSADDMKELTWKADAEGVLVQVVMEGWYKEVTEVLHKLTFELGWKDEGIFYRDRELRSLKQAVEELENDYATLMSICLTLIRDQNDNDTKEEPSGLSVHELGRRKLLELSEFLNSREVSGGQEEKSTPELELEEELAAEQLQHELKLEIVSEVFKQDVPSEFLNSREVSGGQEGKSSPELELEEELAGQELQHELVLEIVSEVFIQKYQEALYMVLDLKFTSLCDYGTVETVEKKVCNNFEELEAQLESFLELEACRLERIRSGCSTSIAKCEFKLENLMKSLADQVNEMKTKISFVQEAIKQQEWKHMVEEDILVLVLWDALAEMYRKLNSEELPQQIRNVQLRLSNSSNDSVNSLDGMDISVSPKKGGDYHPKSENESQRLKCSKILETRLGIQDKDKLILSLKRDIEGLRKEKAVIEQNLDERTEELYSLKRQFWKEKEIWVSKLSQPQRKEVEVQVEALSRHSSASLDLEELRKLEMVRFDSLISELRKEWLLEKEGLLHNISQKEVQGEKMAAELARLKEKEKSSNSTEAGLLARIADLKIQADNLSSERLNQDFHFAKYRQEWQTEKESMRGELDKLLEKESGHVVSEGRLLARIAELETEMESLRLARLDQGSSFLKLKQEWQTERERLLERVSEREDTMSKLAALSEKEKSNAKLIEQLETERDRLITGWRYKEPSATSLMEEKEIALALAIKEKEEEEKKRKFLEIQLQGLRLEVKNLQGLNDKIAHLKGKLESVPRQLELKFAEQIGHSVKASQEFEQRVIHMMQEKSISLDGIKEKCRFLKGHFKSFATREALYKQRLAKELNNLQKAETEVDLLGDEVESLLEILEKVQVAFDLYAPVLQHYPRMTEVAKLVKQEIQLRIDPKYGA